MSCSAMSVSAQHLELTGCKVTDFNAKRHILHHISYCPTKSLSHVVMRREVTASDRQKHTNEHHKLVTWCLVILETNGC